MNHGNRAAWQRAAEKYVREHDELLAEAAAGGSLTAGELAVLEPLLRTAPRVVHLLSGHGLDDVGLVRAGARQVVGVDFSSVTTGAAARRSAQLGLSCAYVIAEVPPVPLADGCAELVYTGKGALIWLADLGLWASEIARILVPGGHLFVHEAHPLVPLWTWDTDEPQGPTRPELLRALARQRHLPGPRRGGAAVDDGRDPHRPRRRRAQAGVVDRARRAVLAPGWSRSRSLGRSAAEHVHVAGPSGLKRLGPVGAGH